MHTMSAGLDHASTLRHSRPGLQHAPGCSVRAVLPFANLTGDPAQDYLTEGMTQEMVAQLGRLQPERLSVIARTSVMRYRKSDKPIDQIGKELGVDYVVEGSARREAGRIRITAELIRVQDQAQLWADSYERELSGVLVLQSDVAQKFARSLAPNLLPAEPGNLKSARAVNPDAHDQYLKGTHHWIKLTPSDLDTAQQYFERALQKDPNYAAAWAGVALVWAFRQQVGITQPAEAGPKAKAAALKAVALDDAAAEAHFALAHVMTWTDWNWAGADAEWKRTVELNSNYPDALAAYSNFLAIMGRRDEAMARIQQAIKLDPFNVTVQSFYAVDLVFARRFDEAIVQARTALGTQPGAPVAALALSQALVAKEMYSEAVALDKELFAGDREILAACTRGYAGAGYQGLQLALSEIMASRFGKQDGTYAWTTIARRCLPGRGPGSCHPVAREGLRRTRPESALPWSSRLRQTALGPAPAVAAAPHESSAVVSPVHPVSDGPPDDTRERRRSPAAALVWRYTQAVQSTNCDPPGADCARIEAVPDWMGTAL